MSFTLKKYDSLDTRIKRLFGGYYRRETEEENMPSIPSALQQLSGIYWGKEEYFCKPAPTLKLAGKQHTTLQRAVVKRGSNVDCAFGRHTIYDDDRDIIHEWEFELEICDIEGGHITIGIIDENDISGNVKFSRGSTNYHALCLDNIDGKVQCKIRSKNDGNWKLRKVNKLKDAKKVNMSVFGNWIHWRNGKGESICNRFVVNRRNINYRMFCTIGPKAKEGMIKIQKFNVFSGNRNNYPTFKW